MARIKTSFMAHRDGEPPAEDDPLLAFTPVTFKQPKRNGLKEERQRKFIAALAASGVVTDAARAAGATAEAFYHLRNRPGAEEFRAAWDAAVDRGIARVESAAIGRAINGVDRMVVSAGQLMGYDRSFNESLVMFILRSRRPDRYGQDWRALKPGHPIYEKIAQEALARYHSQQPDIEDIRAEILRKVEAIERARERKAAEAGREAEGGQALLAGPGAAEVALTEEEVLAAIGEAERGAAEGFAAKEPEKGGE
jgi:phosphatidylserine/phosphatidylglycerophosphate/cardiolipin synthase-like enzyme